ncbi:MAG: hypothetical protein J5I65_11340 [Aridibacter famidurans]|nr:hypothetical protein [Aridibacter famidurans]
MDRREFLALGLAIPFAGTALASVKPRRPPTTWFPKEFDCPICKTENTYLVWGSYGSYIYSWPSKYQLIYWPVTDGPSVYLCKKCHLSVFMWDHDELPKEHLPAIKKALAEVKDVPKFKEYTEVPMSRRLEIAEKVYKLYEKEDSFWCRFERIKGYHYQEEDKKAEANAARKRALELAEKMIESGSYSESLKEVYAISGAMRHFLGDDRGALKDFNKGLSTVYSGDDLTEEEKSNGEVNLNRYLTDYINRVNGADPPRDSKQ